MDRVEGLEKLTGRTRYVDDEQVEDALWGMTVRSPAPRGRIVDIRFDTAIAWDEYVVVDHRDIPGENTVVLIEEDQPLLAADCVRHVHEPVILLAHRSREAVRRAARAVEIVVDPETPIFDADAVPERHQVQYGSDNVLKSIESVKGDVDRALAHATHVATGEYRTGAQEHVYLENQGMLAWQDGNILTIRGSLQCPFYVLKAVLRALDRDASSVRIVQAATGGGFGGKEEYPSMIALHAALLALKAHRPVKIVYDRGEDMAATTKRHPSIVRHRTGVDADGRLVAQDIEVVLDGGAYVTLSPVVLSRGVIHAAGPYACDNVRIRGRAMMTNTVPHGAFRGFGAPQTHFANERHMDVVAAEIGLDPVEFRRRNLLRPGQSTATSQKIDDGANREAILDRALTEIEYHDRSVAHDEHNARHPYLRRGLGVAIVHHGAGFTGSGELMLASELEVAGRTDGSIEVRSANIEMGQGAITIFTQLAAARLGIDTRDVVIAEADTSRVPNSGPTVASRTAMVVGALVERACDDLRERLLLSPDASGLEVTRAIRQTCNDRGSEIVGRATYEPPPEVEWDEETYTGDAYATYAWAAYAADVEVDLRTYDVRVVDFVAVQDVGTVLNDTLARGQIQGGVVQAIGWALSEECTWENGVMSNNQLTNYIIPTSEDVPPIRVFFIESPFAHGPRGAKGLGELPMDAPAPALANAIARATGAAATEIPLTPERLMELVPDVA